MSDFTFLCSNCEAPLAEFLGRDGEEEARKIRALCPHCGDSSFTKEISNQFYLGATEYTSIESIDKEDDVIIINTTKSKKYE